MIRLTDRLVGFNSKESYKADLLTPTSARTKLDPIERGPLAYVTGLVVSKTVSSSKTKGRERKRSFTVVVTTYEIIRPVKHFYCCPYKRWAR